MSQTQWHVDGNGDLSLAGALDRHSVATLWPKLQAWVCRTNDANCDLGGIERVDSAGMAFLIHLIEHAKRQNCHIMLRFVPTQLGTLFQLSNVESLVADHIQNYQR
ncbi:STAS domain-containing protein [Vibrio sp. SM6]|uniref:STAS domain-containing protein n=1 Tax=Vibrio agarilyticus TaxID=2726741 RepID=A0A7X8TPH6_9VIBR|nr:STAS domain-containing protein [Vibrio agarilyticus]NLS12394.1 STAS domain-containing protein [Vibrio agarilyticus]